MTSHDTRWAWRLYVRFVLGGVGLCLLLMLLGYLPTRRWASSNVIGVMAAACGVSLLASAGGGIPVVLAQARRPGAVVAALGLATLVRFGVVLALAIPVVVARVFEPAPFLIWVALSYLVLLVVDARLALRLLRAESWNP